MPTPYLLHVPTGELYAYHEILANRQDMEETELTPGWDEATEPEATAATVVEEPAKPARKTKAKG